MELMRRADALATPVDWLLRSKHNLTLSGGDKLWSRVMASEPLGEIRFVMAPRKGQRAREVVQQVWAQTLHRGPGNAACSRRSAGRVAAADESACAQPGAGRSHD